MTEPAVPAQDAAAVQPAEEWKPEPRQWVWRDLFTAPMLAFKPKCMVVSALTLLALGVWMWLFEQHIQPESLFMASIPGRVVEWLWYLVALVIFSIGAGLVAVFMKADLLDDEFLSFGEAIALYQPRVLSAVLVPVFLVCLLAVYLAQVFVRPIKRLRAGAQQISAGDYHVEIPVEAHDEIGDLTEAFNEMSRSLTVKEDQITQQRDENDQLLHSFMPATVATRFRKGEDPISIEREHVTVIFIDFIGLDRLQADLAADEYLALLDELVRQIGSASNDFGVEGVRTVRNGYLASCGLAVPRLDNLARTIDFAQQCEQIVERFNSEFNTSLRLRAGIGIGRVSGGLAGRHSIVYDIWGPAVNLAYQVKNASQQPGIYVSSRVHDTLQETASFTAGGTVTIDGGDQPIWRLSKVL